MTRHRYIYDKTLECLVEIGNGSNTPEPEKRVRDHRIMSDIQDYRTAASDVAHDNKRVVITSRSRHREFLKDNGYVEVGNEKVPNRYDGSGMSRGERMADIKRAMEQGRR